jgi:N-acetylneuraminic acid mutarotase
MKKLFILLITYHLSLIAYHSKADYWTQKANFPGTNRFGCFSFSIGSKGYIGCGYDSNWAVTQTFWEYDQQSNSWTQKADFDSSARVYATGFSIGNMGYAGLGVSPASGWMQDFHQYNPATNTWSLIADYGGGQRSEACSFVINGKAYVGTGTGTVAPWTFNDLWEYDPITNAWTVKSPYPGTARIKALGFAAGPYGYIVTGYSGSAYFSDIWEYNPVTDSWLQKTNFTFDPRGGSAGFTLFNKIYLGTGINHPSTGSNYPSKDWQKYDPVLNQWTQKNSLIGYPRSESSYFAINNEGYLGIGLNGNFLYSDFWQYTGDPLSIEEDGAENVLYNIYPNPAEDYIIISSETGVKEKINITITNTEGKKIFTQQLTTMPGHPGSYRETIDISHYSQGIYFVELKTSTEKAVKKFVKE